MKKKSGSKIGRLFTRIFNWRVWSDWDRTKSFYRYIIDSIKKLFVPQPKHAEESFTEVVKRLKLSPDDVLARKQGLFRITILMLFIAFLLFCYAVYQLFHGWLLGTILSFIIMSLALVLAFRYHFWYFQIKQQRLGCTIREWFEVGLLGKKP